MSCWAVGQMAAFACHRWYIIPILLAQSGAETTASILLTLREEVAEMIQPRHDTQISELTKLVAKAAFPDGILSTN